MGKAVAWLRSHRILLASLFLYVSISMSFVPVLEQWSQVVSVVPMALTFPLVLHRNRPYHRWAHLGLWALLVFLCAVPVALHLLGEPLTLGRLVGTAVSTGLLGAMLALYHRKREDELHHHERNHR